MLGYAYNIYMYILTDISGVIIYIFTGASLMRPCRVWFSCNVILIVCDYFVLSIRFDGVGGKCLCEQSRHLWVCLFSYFILTKTVLLEIS